MVDNINSWTGQIIVAVVISIIIQMVLPNGKNKKYVEVISGLYILYVILNPILGLDKSFSMFDIKSTIAGISSQSLISQEDISKTYILGLENSLKEKIEENGYSVDYIQFYITSDYSSIAKIEVKMKKNTEFNEEKIKEIVLENFSIKKEEIIIK